MSACHAGQLIVVGCGRVPVRVRVVVVGPWSGAVATLRRARALSAAPVRGADVTPVRGADRVLMWPTERQIP